MTRVSHMALWLVAVIVLIAVGAMPSGAQAHGGHPHAGPAPITAERSASAPEAVALGLPAPTLKSAATTVVRASLQAGMSIGIACDGVCCNGGCRPGTSCCTGAGLAAEITESGPARRPGTRALARALPARTDVVPEALPEPPRSFA